MCAIDCTLVAKNSMRIMRLFPLSTFYCIPIYYIYIYTHILSLSLFCACLLPFLEKSILAKHKTNYTSTTTTTSHDDNNNYKNNDPFDTTRSKSVHANNNHNNNKDQVCVDILDHSQYDLNSAIETYFQSP